MDSKTLRLSILAIVTTFVLVGVVVYAANRDRIHALIGANEVSESEEQVLEEEQPVTTEYGERIGDNLKGFLTADDFFDKSEQRPSVVVVVDNVPVPANSENGGEEESTDLFEVPRQEAPETPEIPEGISVPDEVPSLEGESVPAQESSN